MASGDAPVLDTVMEMTAVSLSHTDLDPETVVGIRLAALIAVDAPASSYMMHIGPALETGLTLDDVQDILVTVAPIVGTAKTVSAAAKIVEALGLAIELALEDEDDE
jgi:Carboxymuconolactone decarboxylase family